MCLESILQKPELHYSYAGVSGFYFMYKGECEEMHRIIVLPCVQFNEILMRG